MGSDKEAEQLSEILIREIEELQQDGEPSDMDLPEGVPDEEIPF